MNGALRTPEIIAAAYFLFLLTVVWLRGPRERRAAVTLRALTVTAGIGAIAAASAWTDPAGYVRWSIEGLRDWLPGIYVLLAYWLSGQFFVAPNPDLERRLASLDSWLFSRGLGAMVHRAPRLLLEYLEFAYLCVYPLLPGAFLWLLVAGHANAANRFWTATLIAELACYACMPWVQTRPPRVLESRGNLDDRAVAVRRLNALVLREGSVQANTVPSGHAAGALAIACVTMSLDVVAGSLFLALALSIAAATVIGRYHFALDAIGGAAAAAIGCAVAGYLPP